jgi:hypothetical protein
MSIARSMTAAAGHGGVAVDKALCLQDHSGMRLFRISASSFGLPPVLRSLGAGV